MGRTAAMKQELPLPGFTISELTVIAGKPSKELYRAIREQRLDAYTDVTGRLRVSYGDAYAFLNDAKK